MAKTAKKSGGRLRRFLLSFLLVILIGTGIAAWVGYKLIFRPNVSLGEKKSEFIYIRTGWNFSDVQSMLVERKLIKNTAAFEWLAEKKDYKNNIRPGRYRLKKGMSTNELVNMLKAGLQEPVEFTLNEVRTKEQLASRAGGKLELDSVILLEVLNDDEKLGRYGMNTENIMSMFIPGRYKFFWNTGVEQFMDSMAANYKQFWNAERRSKAKQIGLSQSEVTVLASIIQQESYIERERPRIAGVYMNRLKRNMLLQADPTLIWAAGDFTIRRVLDVHKQIDSPYNTYRYKGLPPGPICLPSQSAIDAVLNYERHNYIYFCAKEDLSGTSVFAKDYEEHQKNARRYQDALNKRKIMK